MIMNSLDRMVSWVLNSSLIDLYMKHYINACLYKILPLGHPSHLAPVRQKRRPGDEEADDIDEHDDCDDEIEIKKLRCMMKWSVCFSFIKEAAVLAHVW